MDHDDERPERAGAGPDDDASETPAEAAESDSPDVGPRHAAGNRGWNEPYSEEPETIEGAVGPGDA